jgi:hypothetical protein
MANTGFIRFRNVNIPENSRIIKAVVIFTGFSPDSAIDTNVLCYFEDTDNANAPSSKVDLDGRPLTSGISWKNIEEWKDNLTYRTPNLASILQTVIDRNGWSSGNDILFLAVDDASVSQREWSAIEFRGGVEKAVLKVAWNPPEQIDTPVIEPEETFHLDEFSCTIRTFPTDASIYYTTDETIPNENSTLYTSPISITDDIIVAARAYKEYWTDSEIATRSYEFYGVTWPSTDTRIYDHTYGEIRNTSVDVDSSGYIHVLAMIADVKAVFQDHVDGQLIYVTNSSGFWVSEKIDDLKDDGIPSIYGPSSSIKVGSDGTPHVIYRTQVVSDYALWYAKRTGPSTWSKMYVMTVTGTSVLKVFGNDPHIFNIISGYYVRRTYGPSFSQHYTYNVGSGAAPIQSGEYDSGGNTNWFVYGRDFNSRTLTHIRNQTQSDIQTSAQGWGTPRSTLGSNDSFHVIAPGDLGVETWNSLYYFTNASGSWKAETLMDYASFRYYIDSNSNGDLIIMHGKWVMKGSYKTWTSSMWIGRRYYSDSLRANVALMDTNKFVICYAGFDYYLHIKVET